MNDPDKIRQLAEEAGFHTNLMYNWYERLTKFVALHENDLRVDQGETIQRLSLQREALLAMVTKLVAVIENHPVVSMGEERQILADAKKLLHNIETTQERI